MLIGGIAAAVAVVAGVWAYARHESACRIIGVVTVRPGDARTLVRCSATAAAHGISEARMDADRGLLELVLEAQDAGAGIAQVDQVGLAIVAAARTGGPDDSASRAGPGEQRESLLRQLEQIEGRIAALRSQMFVTAAAEYQALLDRWVAAERQRKELEVARAGLDRRAAGSLPDESQLVLDPAQIAAAELADEKLQAELAVLAQQQAQVAETLGALLEQGGPHFDALIGAVSEGATHVAKALQADHEENIKRPLRAMAQALSDWARVTSVLAKTWAHQRQRLAGLSVDDLVASQAELERAAREFVDQAAVARTSFDQAFELLGQVDGQATKALVLQSTLSRELRPAVEARQGAEAVARSVMLTDNRELAGMVQRLTGLQRQVRERRAEMVRSVRQQALAERRAQREREIKTQREQIEQSSRQLDEALAECSAAARKLLGESAQRDTILAQLTEQEHQRAETYKALAALEADAAKQLVAPDGPAEDVHYVPARAELVASAGGRVWHGLAAGLLAFVVCSVAGAGLCALRAWRGTRETIEACTRELRTMKGRR